MNHIIEELWQKKDLMWNFAITDLRLRYRNSILGFFWTFLEPLLMLSVMYIVFTNIFKNSIEYFPLYLLLGLIIWEMINRSTDSALNSTLSKGEILTQVRIPLVIPPISASITSIIMLSFELTVFGVFIIIFQFVPTITILLLPVFIVMQYFFVLSLCIPLSVLNIKFRDMKFIWGVILRAGFFLHPIFYNIEILPDKIQQILNFIPSVKLIIMSQDAVLYNKIPSLQDIGITIFGIVISFLIGFAIYKKLSKNVIEEI